MPKNPLMVYIRDHLAKNETKKRPGPVITISREYGCLGWEVATGLVEKINAKFGYTEEEGWKAVHREIINKAAAELEIPAHLIEKISRHQIKGILNEMIHTLPYVPDDIKVKKTIAKIVWGLGQHGRYVILGRGGVVVNGNIEDSLHIFLYAPVEWRVKQIVEREESCRDKALHCINTVDRERTYLRNLFAGEEVTYNRFTACFNTSVMTTEEIEDAILYLAEQKNLFKA